MLSPKDCYQKLYKDLFGLIMGGQAFSTGADELRRGMDAMPGQDEQKVAWGHEIGAELYNRRVYGSRDEVQAP